MYLNQEGWEVTAQVVHDAGQTSSVVDISELTGSDEVNAIQDEYANYDPAKIQREAEQGGVTCVRRSIAELAQIVAGMSAPGSLSFSSVGKTYGSGLLRGTCGHGPRYRSWFVRLLVGPSGCGKSTALKAAAGLEPYDAGSIDINGAPPRRGAETLQSCSKSQFCFHGVRVLQNVLLPAEIMGLERESSTAHALELLELVGLAHCAHKRTWELSGGMQRNERASPKYSC